MAALVEGLAESGAEADADEVAVEDGEATESVGAALVGVLDGSVGVPDGDAASDGELAEAVGVSLAEDDGVEVAAV